VTKINDVSQKPAFNCLKPRICYCVRSPRGCVSKAFDWAAILPARTQHEIT